MRSTLIVAATVIAGACGAGANDSGEVIQPAVTLMLHEHRSLSGRPPVTLYVADEFTEREVAKAAKKAGNEVKPLKGRVTCDGKDRPEPKGQSLTMSVDSLTDDFAIVRWYTECFIPPNEAWARGTMLTRERRDELRRVGNEWQVARTRSDMVKS